MFRFDPLCVSTASTIDLQAHCSHSLWCNGMSQMVLYTKFQDADSQCLYTDLYYINALIKDLPLLLNCVAMWSTHCARPIQADHLKMLRLSKDRRFSVLKYAGSLASEVCKQTHRSKHVQVNFVFIGYFAVYDVTT